MDTGRGGVEAESRNAVVVLHLNVPPCIHVPRAVTPALPYKICPSPWSQSTQVYEIGEPETSASTAMMMAQGPVAAGEDDASSSDLSSASKTSVFGLVAIMVHFVGFVAIHVQSAV